jgi:hypothetical protein
MAEASLKPEADLSKLADKLFNNPVNLDPVKLKT